MFSCDVGSCFGKPRRRPGCNSLDVQILKGVVSKDHIHLHLSYPPSLGVSDLVKRLKGRSAKLLLGEFPELKRRYWAGLPLQRPFLGYWLWGLARWVNHRRVITGLSGSS